MSPMRFAVDAHALGRHLTGNETYVRSLLRSFAEIDGDSDFLAYVSEPGSEALVPKGFEVRRVSSNPYTRLGWDLPTQLRHDKADLIHVQYTAPIACNVPTVVTVHDVSYLEHPEYFTFGRRTQLRCTVAYTIRRASAVLTVSEFSKDAILRAYDIPADKVHVVPNASSADFRVISREKATAAAMRILGFPQPFVLTVGDLQPRKNHVALIAAFARLVAKYPQLSHRLVLVGKNTWFAPKVREAAQKSGVADRIHFAGFVSDSELINLYNSADCFIFPSLYEGFGLPIIEAMACGRAVACSDTSAMPEVADGAGLLFDPMSEDAMVRAMADILRDGELRARMERLAVQRATVFSWQRSAKATLDVYRQVVEESGRRVQVRVAESIDAVAQVRKRG